MLRTMDDDPGHCHVPSSGNGDVHLIALDVVEIQQPCRGDACRDGTSAAGEHGGHRVGLEGLRGSTDAEYALVLARPESRAYATLDRRLGQTGASGLVPREDGMLTLGNAR